MISLTKVYSLISKFLCENYDNRTSGQDGTVSTHFRDLSVSNSIIKYREKKIKIYMCTKNKNPHVAEHKAVSKLTV